MQRYEKNENENNLPNNCNCANTVFGITIGIAPVVFVYVGSLGARSAVGAASVPALVRIGCTPEVEAPSVVDVDFELYNVAAGETAEEIVAFGIRSEYIGEPQGAYAAWNPECCVATAVVSVARNQCDFHAVGQWAVKHTHYMFVMRSDAVGEVPCGMVATLGAVGEHYFWVVEVNERAVCLDA